MASVAQTRHNPAPAQRNILANARAAWPAVMSWVVLCVFTILYSSFIGWVLLGNNPYIGNTPFDYSTMNLLLAVLSQLYAMLLCFVIASVLDNWRLASTTLDSGHGVSALAYAQLSPGTDFFTTSIITIGTRLKSPIGLIKLALPFIALSFGSVLKFQSSFAEDVFGMVTPVYAGSVILDTRLLKVVAPETPLHLWLKMENIGG
ncbi:hypothetical protein QBC47DRAFT_464249 [Echria macrotheca]|uniref:Uncharacterized protein n=1 Tax=Echria macrotheca TaxID=438768 RepID=A0AAJ0B3L0_9PEZI|nr:hypothetical protein QBC47DRAFT_464249 [Echria macrotheca]